MSAGLTWAQTFTQDWPAVLAAALLVALPLAVMGHVLLRRWLGGSARDAEGVLALACGGTGLAAWLHGTRHPDALAPFLVASVLLGFALAWCVVFAFASDGPRSTRHVP